MKTKSIKEHLNLYFNEKRNILDRDYPGIQFNRFLREYCSFDNSNPDDVFFMENPAFFEKIKLGTPFEYINFESFFFKQNFYINSDVLIPRSETEILCEKAIEFIEENYHKNFRIYDIGTGSGVIPLTIATEVSKQLTISACDISKDAIAVANINYENLFSKIYKDTIVSFEIRDRLSNIRSEYDLITSNPPYIKEEEDRLLVHPQADSFEPHLALYLKDNEYESWFETLFKQVSHNLKKEGLFIMEGHEDHLDALYVVANKYFQNVELMNDYTQRKRFLLARGK